MSFFPKAPLIAGIEVTSRSFKIALLKKKRKGWEVEKLEEVPHNVKLLDKVPKEALIVTSLSSREVLVRQMELPLTKEKAIDSAYEFQAEPLLPFPLEKGVVQKINIATHAEGTLLTLLAAKKEHLERHIKFFNEHGIDPMIVTCTPVALSMHSQTHAPTLMIHLDKEEGTVALFEGGKLLSARAFDKERAEIETSVSAILSAHKSKKIDSITLISEDPADAVLIEKATNYDVTLLAFDGVGQENVQKYGVAIGLALSATHKDAPNFRAKENNFSLKWRRVKKPLLTYFALSLLLFVTALSFEKKVLEERESGLLKRSSSLFATTPSSLEELNVKLALHEGEILKIPDTFPLLPQLPKVKDILATLCADPRLLDEHGKPLIAMEEFRYSMVSRPNFERREEKYQVKVEVTFQATSPAAAHTFHEMLLSPNHPFVEGKKEVEWSGTKGKYKATFYLKDKTRYS